VADELPKDPKRKSQRGRKIGLNKRLEKEEGLGTERP